MEVVDCDEIAIAFATFITALELRCGGCRRGHCCGSEVEELEAVAHAHALKLLELHAKVSGIARLAGAMYGKDHTFFGLFLEHLRVETDLCIVLDHAIEVDGVGKINFALPDVYCHVAIGSYTDLIVTFTCGN